MMKILPRPLTFLYLKNENTREQNWKQDQVPLVTVKTEKDFQHIQNYLALASKLDSSRVSSLTGRTRMDEGGSFMWGRRICYINPRPLGIYSDRKILNPLKQPRIFGIYQCKTAARGRGEYGSNTHMRRGGVFESYSPLTSQGKAVLRFILLPASNPQVIFRFKFHFVRYFQN